MSALSSKASENQLTVFQHIKYEHLIAGLSGGAVSTLFMHPLDVIKIRFAVNDGRINATPKYTSIANAFSTIYRNEGFKGLYRGITPNVIGASASWGLYFFFYNAIKLNIQDGNANTQLGPGTHLLAASASGFVTLLITNPIWVTKTRLCLQYCTETRQVKMYDSMLDCLIKIYKREGFLGYYKGLLPGTFGVSHGAVQFMAYEELKKAYSWYNNIPLNAKLGTVENLTFSASSKILAVFLTYPYQVVRARLQNQHYVYKNMRHCISQTWTYEGWRGFYKGMGTNLIRVTPATMITFLVYENVSHFLLKYRVQNVM